MIKSKFLIEKVNNKYLDLKAEKYSIKSHNDAVLSCNDEYVELKNSLGKANFDLAKAEYEQDVEKIKNLSTQVEIYEARIKKLALSLNLLPITYACKTCKDTGVYNGKRCKCYYKYLTEYALESLGVTAPENADFENLIQTPELSKQFKIIKNYADNFPNTQFKNLVFSGNVGTGKTQLAKCVLTCVKKSDNIALFLTSTDLNSIFTKMHTSEIDRSLILEVLCGADLLIIDDLGTEPIFKNVTIEYLLSLISYRIDNGKHTIVTTNLTDKELQSRYNERLSSRLLDTSKSFFIPFYSNDFRKFRK